MALRLYQSKTDSKVKGMQRSCLCMFGKNMPCQTCGAKQRQNMGGPRHELGTIRVEYAKGVIFESALLNINYGLQQMD